MVLTRVFGHGHAIQVGAHGESVPIATDSGANVKSRYVRSAGGVESFAGGSAGRVGGGALSWASWVGDPASDDSGAPDSALPGDIEPKPPNGDPAADAALDTACST